MTTIFTGEDSCSEIVDTFDRETSTIFTRRKEDSCSEIVDTFDGRNDNGDDPGPRTPVGDLSGYSFECWVQSWQNLLGVISVHYQN